MTPKTQEERAAFEKWAGDMPRMFGLMRGGEESAWPGQYRDYHVQCCWDAWQEGRAPLLAEIDEQCRLLGMGGEREAGLLAKVDTLQREIERLKEFEWMYKDLCR